MLVGLGVLDRDPYPYRAVADGIAAAGDRVTGSPQEWEGIVTWNNYGTRKKRAEEVKARGGVHVVMENGHFRKEDGFYLMARDGFNGTGWTPFKRMGPARWRRFNLEIEPWERNGHHVLVCGQMGGGYSEMAMKDDWPDQVISQLLKVTGRPIWYRPHHHRQKYPKQEHGDQVKLISHELPLEDCLNGAHACVVWTSSAVTTALRLGVASFYTGSTVALQACCSRDLRQIGNPGYRLDQFDREQAFQDFAWQHWQTSELRRGLPWEILRDA